MFSVAKVHNILFKETFSHSEYVKIMMQTITRTIYFIIGELT